MYFVRTADEELGAELSGRFQYRVRNGLDMPAVGDWVIIDHQPQHDAVVLHDLVPRQSKICRKLAGRAVDFQMIAANVDCAFLLQACDIDFNVKRLDRYLVMAREGGMQASILLSKIDLVTPEKVDAFRQAVRDHGIDAPILCISSVDGAGLAELESSFVPGHTYCLLGSSGVGKSTLTNALLGEERQAVGEMSSTGEGMHCSTRRELMPLANGAWLIDTPGMRELGMIGMSGGLEQSFDDILELISHCKFSNCTCTKEPGCAVQAALASGDLHPERWASYCKLREESKLHDMSYADRRKKGKGQSKKIREVQKYKRR